MSLSLAAGLGVAALEFLRRRKRKQKALLGGAPWRNKAPSRYLPFCPPAGVMNLRCPDHETDWIDIDTEYAHTLEMKSLLLAMNPSEVIGSIGHKDEGAAGSDALDLVLSDLAERFPGMVFREGPIVVNRVTGLRWDLNVTPPLQVAALLVQEDLVVMLPQCDSLGCKNAYVLACAVVCFADRWHLQDKMGLTLDGIHSPVPHYKPISKAVDGFFRKLEASHGLRVRYNFTFQRCSALHLEEDAAPDSVGTAQTYLRVERQGFRRLPNSDGVLFTIRTYISPISEVPAHAQSWMERLEPV